MSLNVYWAMAFILPKGVIREVEKRMRHFLWKGNSTVGYPKVAWSTVCRPKEEGGLGIRDILAINKALMCRHLWNVIQGNQSSIWVRWIAHNHLRHKSVWTVDVKGGSWGWRKLLRLRSALLPYIDLKIGDGEYFSLWHDPWHSLGPLIQQFPCGPSRMNIPAAATLSTVIVDGDWCWPLITDMECIEIIHVLPTIHNGSDSILWQGVDFSTKVVYDIFRSPGPKVGWYSLLLGPCKIPKYSFVLWLAILEKLSTMDKPWLSHLGGVCVLCGRAVETHEHLFFRCSYSRRTHNALTVSNAEILSTQVDCPDGLHEDGGESNLHIAPTPSPNDIPDGITEEDDPGGEPEILEGEAPGKPSGDFDSEEFYDLATRVLDGDSDSLASLNTLKVRWEPKFKTRRNLTFKSVTGRPLSGRGSLCCHDESYGQVWRPSQLLLRKPSKLNFLLGVRPTRRVRLARNRVRVLKNIGHKTVRLIKNVLRCPIDDLVDSEDKEGRGSGIHENQDCPSKLAPILPMPAQDDQLEQSAFPAIYVGNVKLQAGPVDNIAGAFLQSSRKTLHFFPPTRQNGEVIIRPTKEVVDNGSKKWHTTAVGYFLGRRPYFPLLEAFVRANWKGLQHVSATSSGFFFFHFHTRIAMEDPLYFSAGAGHVPTTSTTHPCSGLDSPQTLADGVLDRRSPVLRNGKEDPKRVDVEYEWLPQKCTNCCSLGYVETFCPANSMKKSVAPPIKVFVKKWSVIPDPAHTEKNTELAGASNSVCNNSRPSGLDKGKGIALHNSYGALDTLTTEEMTISCRALISAARLMVAHDQGGLVELLDDSEVCGRAADTRASMLEFRNCIRDTGLVQIPVTGCPYTWHNCSEGMRSLWKRLDRMLVNTAWLDTWPDSSYICALLSTSDHSPLILSGMNRNDEHATFRFDNYLTHLPGFFSSVEEIWKHRIAGTAMYETVSGKTALDETWGSKFQSLLRQNRRLNLEFLGSELKHTITTKEASLLIAPVSQSEVKEAFFDIDVESAPGPDGYTAAFYRAAWPVVGQDVFQAVGEFFRTGKLLKQINTTLIVLIPKNAFVPGRSIIDNVLLAQELLAGYNQRRLPQRCTLKVDIQKAYDSVEWDFLLEVLRKKSSIMEENSLCSLSHTTPKTHTRNNNSNAPAAMVDEGEDGEIVDGGHGALSTTPTTVPMAGGGSKMVDECDEDGGYGAVLAAPTKSPKDEGESTMEKLKAEFNIKEFFELALRVIDDGDSESMEMLKNLKIKWMTKLGGEIAMTGHGGFRSVRTREPTPFPATRPARRVIRGSTTAQAVLSTAAPTSGSAEPHCIMSHGARGSTAGCSSRSSRPRTCNAAPPSGFTEPKAHGAPHRPLAAASTAEPSFVAKSPQPLAVLPSPTPLTATTEVTEAGSSSPTWAVPPLADIWPSTSPLTAALLQNVQQPPSAEPCLGQNGRLHHQTTAVSASFVQPAKVNVSSQSWARVAPPQHHAAQVRQQAPPVRSHPRPTAIPTTSSAPVTPMPEFFIGNVPMHPNMAFKIEDDKIAAAFHKSSRKTLNFIPPSMQNGEVIVRPSIDIIRAGSQRWNTTAVGYFLGKKPYFHHLNEFVRSIWPAVREVKATSNGFFFFQFENVEAMEEVIEGGPWLYLGQPMCYKSGTGHEGLSTVASGIGRPLYPDAITRACTRLDFARVCVMLNVNSKLPKHVVIMMPNEHGGESACKVDVEYEWIPHKCTGCLSLGHSTKECPISKPTKPAVSIYVRKSTPTIPVAPELKLMEKVHAPQVSEEIHHQPEIDRVGDESQSMEGIRVRILSFLTLLIYCEKLMMMQTDCQGVLT
ncbi:putative ribonuclease H protein [Sesamum angolense]|uniref:Ribonuclease H protein n=1 Tax=Sesamum angolense TaxID=2727404 RepID=A0AAE1TBV4_9LAMI|nr:putative ribonuclease H protein [Sesamum angolense]